MTFDLIDILIGFSIGFLFGAVFAGLMFEANKHQKTLIHTRKGDIDEHAEDYKD